MRINCLFRLITCLLVAVICQIPSNVSASTRKKYPGGKCYIWRYALKDKQGSSYSLEHPGRWLSHKAVERRKRQGITIDSTDLPVSAKYLRQIERLVSVSQSREKSVQRQNGLSSAPAGGTTPSLYVPTTPPY